MDCRQICRVRAYNQNCMSSEQPYRWPWSQSHLLSVCHGLIIECCNCPYPLQDTQNQTWLGVSIPKSCFVCHQRTKIGGAKKIDLVKNYLGVLGRTRTLVIFAKF